MVDKDKYMNSLNQYFRIAWGTNNQTNFEIIHENLKHLVDEY